MTEWISVKDRLPEAGEDYTYLISDGNEIGMGYLEYDSRNPFDNELYWHDETHALKTCTSGWPQVTYWMLLPKPPEQSQSLSDTDQPQDH